MSSFLILCEENNAHLGADVHISQEINFGSNFKQDRPIFSAFQQLEETFFRKIIVLYVF